MNNKFLKGLALTLAATLAFTAVPATANAAVKKQPTKATKITFSPTKATVDNGKSKSVKIKLNKAATGKVTIKLKSSNSKIAKLNKSSVVVKKGKKVSGAFKVTGKTAGKSAKVTAYFYNKSGKKISKTFKLTVNKEAAKTVAVTGVTLDNTTPKVGDTITATVAPEKATNVTFQWYEGDTAATISNPISGATTKDLAVTEDMLGKYLQVVVNGDENSTANAATVAAVAKADISELAITEAKQVSATEAAITFNKAPGTLTYVVKSGSSSITQSVEKTVDNTVTLQFASKLAAGEYTVTATDTEGKKYEGKFTAEAAKLADVKFRNTNLVVSANTNDGMKTAYAMIDSVDQWGNHINLTSPTINISKGTASFKTENGLITATAPADAQNPYYVLNEKVVITVMYDNNQKVLTDTFTVVTASSLTSIEFGDVQTDVETYKDKKLTQSNVRKNIYFVPVKSATDSEGLPVTTSSLNKMLEQKTQTLFISPNTNAGMIYADEFVEKTIDGVKTPCLMIKAGTQLKDLSMDLTCTVSVLSQGGAQTTVSVPVVRDPVIDTLTITTPDLYSGKEVKLTMAAVDQYGDTYDLYANQYAATQTNNNVQSATYHFVDKTTANSNATDTTFTVTMPSADSSFRVVKNTADKTLDFYIKPVNTNSGQSNETEGYVNISGTTANFKPIAVMNLKVNKARTPEAVSELKDYKAKITGGSAYTLNVTDKVKFAWSDGVKMDSTEKTNNVKFFAYPLVEGTYSADTNTAWKKGNTADGLGTNSTTIADADDAGEIWYGVSTSQSKFVYTTELNHDDATQDAVYTGSAVSLTQTPGTNAQQSLGGASNIATVGTTTGLNDTMTIRIYKLSRDTTGFKIAEVSKKEFSFTITSEADTKFTLSIPDTLYVGKVGTDDVELKIAGEDGSNVNSSKLNANNVQIVDQSNSEAEFAFNATSKKITCTKIANKDKIVNHKGTATVTASIENESTGKTQTVSATLNYSNEAPYVKTIGLFKDADFNDEITDHNFEMTENNATFGYLKLRDQYDTDFVVDGGDLKVAVQNYKNGTNGAGNITSARYANKLITLYGDTNVSTAKASLDVILSYKGASGASETFTIGVTTPTALTLASNPAATLTALSDTGSVTSMTYGTANATTGIKLVGKLSDGSTATADSLKLAKMTWKNPAGATVTITPASSTTSNGSAVVPAWVDGSDIITTDTTTNAGVYTGTFYVDGVDGTVDYSFTVAQKTLKAADLHTSTTKNTITGGSNFSSGVAKAGESATKYYINTNDAKYCTLTAGSATTAVTKTGTNLYVSAMDAESITFAAATAGTSETTHNGQTVTVTPSSLNYTGTATITLADLAGADASMTITD